MKNWLIERVPALTIAAVVIIVCTGESIIDWVLL